MLSPQDTAEAAIREIVQIGEHYGIEVKGRIRTARSTPNAILRELESARQGWLVMGVRPARGSSSCSSASSRPQCWTRNAPGAAHRERGSGGPTFASESVIGG